MRRKRTSAWRRGAILAWLSLGAVAAADLPEGFVYLHDVAPTIEADLKYCDADNFVGAPVDGYERPVCVVSRAAADALRAAQAELSQWGLTLIVFDAFRPQRAVDHFVRWAADPDDVKTKAAHYPDVPKDELFERGYIAAQSSHSRGSAVDLTLGYAREGGAVPLDMGAPFDFFGERSWTAYAEITPQQRANRMLLSTVLAKHGFKNYPKEWWHFNLRNEPFPDRYFDFPIR